MKRNVAAWDRFLDWAVVPGYTKLGWWLRRSQFETLAEQTATRQIMVTGANSGIGFACAQQLARQGVTVHMVCRNRERGEQARQALIETCAPLEAPVLWCADLGTCQ